MQKRWFGFFLGALFIVSVVLVNQYYIVPTFDQQPQASADDSLKIEPIEIKEPNFLYGMVVDDYAIIEDKIKRNQVLGDILLQYNVPSEFIHQISNLSKKVFDVRKIAPDKKYTVICDQDSLRTARAFVYEPNPIDYIVFRFEDTLWVDVCQREVTVVEKSIAGEIKTN